MARRPVFIASDDSTRGVRVEEIDFPWFAGMSRQQAQRSIDSLHDAARARLGVDRMLEISSRSRDPLGVALSAFNLPAAMLDVEWPLTPTTAFYDWLYVNALHRQTRLAAHVLAHRAFTDIAFNPGRSINCQASSAALYVWLHERGLLVPTVLASRDGFLHVTRGFA